MLAPAQRAAPVFNTDAQRTERRESLMEWACYSHSARCRQSCPGGHLQPPDQDASQDQREERYRLISKYNLPF